MKFLPILLIFTGCVTRLTAPGLQFSTPANATRLHLTGPGVTLDVDGLNHSTPTRAFFTGIGHAASQIGAAGLPYVSGVPMAVKAMGTLPATLPAFRAPQPELRP